MSKKRASGRVSESTNVPIPTAVMTDRSLSIMESIVEHLMSKGYTYRELGILLNRDERTIWTVAHRAKQKRATQR
ncbi:MAG: hypothetical protein ABIH41_02950 [Nanoarchaeota archaeon]